MKFKRLPVARGVTGRLCMPCFTQLSLARCIALLTLTLAFPALAQEVDVPAGPPPGELQCPYYKKPGRKKHRQHRHHVREIYEAPSVEELAGLPEPREVQPQDIELFSQGRHEEGRPFSIALWGDSHTASGFFSEELLRALGVPRDKVQPTFIPPDMGRSGVRLPIRKYCQGAGWSYEYAYVSRQTDAPFAKSLVNMKSNKPGSYLWVDFRSHPPEPNLRGLDVLYVPPAAGKRTLVGLAVDDGPEQIIELAHDGHGKLRIRGEQYISVIRLRLIEGTLALQGFAPEYVEQPDLYFDTLSIPGATFRGWKVLNTDYLKEQDGGKDYDLVLVEFGTNEGNDRHLSYDRYASDLRDSLQNMRMVYPGALCVLIGPPDRGVLVKHRYRRHGRRHYRYRPATHNVLKYAKIHQKLGSIQRDIAGEYGCSYWSWQDAMGGPGASYHWLRHSPALMGRDITHMTVSGLKISARRFVADIKLSKYMQNSAEQNSSPEQDEIPGENLGDEASPGKASQVSSNQLGTRTN